MGKFDFGCGPYRPCTLNIEAGGEVSSGTGNIGYLEDSTGVATVTGIGSQWNAPANFRVGYGGDGTLNIEAGGVVNNKYGSIGNLSSSTGVATVTGVGSQWNNSWSLSLGFAGTGSSGTSEGTLNIEAGGLVSDKFAEIAHGPGSRGQATVTGSGSRWNNSDGLTVGANGYGTLNIESEGVVSNSIGYIGHWSASRGEATVTGSGSQWNISDNLFLGGTDTSDGGVGTLNLADSGQVNVGNDLYTGTDTALTVSDTDSNGNLWVRNGSTIVHSGPGYVGLSSGSTGVATVTGSGSQWTPSASALHVGYSGNGTLNVEAGGVVTNRNGYIGYGSGSTGVATVTGSGSQWTPSASALHVGYSSNGTLNVEAGGVASSEYGYIGNTSISTGVATVSGSGSQWNNSSYLYVGNHGDGTLNVEAGGVVSSDIGYIGLYANSTGAVTVRGSGSQWNVSDELLVGTSGNATLNIEAGGVVTNSYSRSYAADGYIGGSSGSTGVATVTGSGSQWNNSNNLFLGGTDTSDGGMGALNLADSGQVNVGNDLYPGTYTALTVSDTGSNGNLWVRNGSTIDNSGNAYIGLNSGSTGVATVTGSGSQWNNSDDLFVGISGNGTLNIEAGGLASNTIGYIGSNTSSMGVATVTGIGSQWNNSSNLYVGYFGGDGALNVEAGGVVSSMSGYIGNSAISTGVATVTGNGSQWNNSDSLYLGGSNLTAAGTGTLNVQDSGLVSVANTLKIWGPGTLNLDGGTLQAGMLDHTDGGTFNFLDGTLNVETFAGDLMQNGGTLVIGSSPGIANVTGTYIQLGGALEIELFSGGSPVAGTDFDQLTANAVFLNGTLDLFADPSYSPTLGDTFPIISTTNGVLVTGDVNNVYLSGGFTFDVSYGASEVTLEVIAALLGDFNLDGTVYGNDLEDPVDGWEARYGVDLDGGDFLDWQRNFGAGAPLAASSAVPEPSSFALIAVGLLGVGCRRRRRV